ncbi:MAG: RagB/SusD family nutrient uptake outer membrane protein [Fermentimonas sp.]|jgi:hypothetical protein
MIMKKISILFLVSFVFFMYTSCNEWLDVRSKEEILQEDAFKQGGGYRSALVGIYRLLADQKLWGKELTWGFASAAGRNYSVSSLGNSAAYRAVMEGKGSTYERYIDAVLAGIWETGYNAIANCNNLLKNIETTDNSIFVFPWERDMIIAEARGIRALVHFELLRYFVAAPITGYKGVAIPYVRDYPEMSPLYNSLDEVLEFIIEDLEFARETLRYVDIDCLFEPNIMSYISTYLFQGIQNFLEDGNYGNGFGFFSKRITRMNYWGATALLARVYSYKRDNAKAVEYIDELLDEWAVKGKSNFGFGWYQYDSNPNKIDGKRCPEPLLCFWNKNNMDNYKTAAGTNYMKMNTLNSLFGADIDTDYRYIALYDQKNRDYRVWKEPNDPAYDMTSHQTRTFMTHFSGLLPVIELPELYYIKCEYFAEEGLLDQAAETLKMVKDSRGIVTPTAAEDYNSFMEILINDATRDFLTRGQTWHYLKKLNWPVIYDGKPVLMEVPEGYYVFPIPESETNFY